MKRDGNRDVSGMVAAAGFILVGLMVLWDSTTMVDSDSFVFPVTVALVMMGLCLFFIVWNLMKAPGGGKAAGEVDEGSTPRRVGLVIAMLGSAFIMPYTGFVIAGLLAFAVIMVIAMFEKWTRGNLIVYPLVCVAVVAGFYFLFAKALLVPLPEAPFL